MVTRELPDDIYGATIVYWLQLDTGTEIVTFCAILVLFAFVVVLQCVLSLYLFVAIDDAAGDLGETCAETSPLLRWGCCLLFTAQIIKDFIQTYDLSRWLTVFK